MSEKTLQDFIKKGAIISDCNNYRYSLWRIWDESKPKVMFLMLNPSTADANNDDPTIRRCIDYAKRWGYGGLFVCNLFSHRATNPKDLFLSPDPFGPNNAHHVKVTALECDKIICAWGNSAIVRRLKGGSILSDLLFAHGPDKFHYLDLSKDNTPKHPLYLLKDLLPKPYLF